MIYSLRDRPLCSLHTTQITRLTPRGMSYFTPPDTLENSPYADCRFESSICYRLRLAGLLQLNRHALHPADRLQTKTNGRPKRSPASPALVSCLAKHAVGPAPRRASVTGTHAHRHIRHPSLPVLSFSDTLRPDQSPSFHILTIIPRPPLSTLHPQHCNTNSTPSPRHTSVRTEPEPTRPALSRAGCFALFTSKDTTSSYKQSATDAQHPFFQRHNACAGPARKAPPARHSG